MSTWDAQKVNDWNKQIIQEFRANEGNVGGTYQGGSLLLLTTIGRKSGEERVAPLGYLRDGDRYIVVASFMGAPKHPEWYLNLVEHPEVTVEVGKEKFKAIATTLVGAEREQMMERWPMAKDHQARTIREIPFVALQPVK
jgi:deazaflavin-dependent oxidoreductase (nitroreductase family)